MLTPSRMHSTDLYRNLSKNAAADFSQANILACLIWFP